MVLTKEDGQYLIDVAREAIELYLDNRIKISVPKDCPKYLFEKLGVFVTLNKNNNLRGCIGYPEPVMPLIEATINSAISAAVSDYRFPIVRTSELPDIRIELTVLTKPELIEVDNPHDYPSKITIGEDGLIIEEGYSKGLLLPQVATENNMDEEEFLSHTCLKAGLSPNAWFSEDVEIYKFQGQIFDEII
ncbi:MAG: TIGR00296 family protein [Methanobrevibacter wolinii]|uniref:TIGR00296 family protein n=1 Tax=Methanobrevibacter wolinii TaxID=190977 RepID=UPI0005B29574|nr:TIGR00296 family protein [Methanobrevibacter wolinii]MDD5960226.1 TIGR00296 family protein [Methanobrevibacter wolinii]